MKEPSGPGPSFADLPLTAGFLGTLDQLGYTQPTAVQRQALPLALSGRDLVVQSSTGSGKTAVFALALLSRILPRFFGVQALVLCPTRELADQVASEIRRLGRSLDQLKVVTLCGGVPLRGQAATLAHGAHVVVGTPGRVLDHLGRRTLVLEGLRTLVLDEADRMLDMGFIDDMVAVARLCPPDRQTLLFSATYPPDIAAVSAPFLRSPAVVEVEGARPAIAQRFYRVLPGTRLVTLAAALAHFRPGRTVVFVNTKAQGREVADFLQGQGVVARELSGDLDQRERDEVAILFEAGCLSVLVATDVASRGLDISDLDCVVNFDPSPDPEVHVHRIGRTGRAGASGLALTLVGENEGGLVDRIQAFQGLDALPWGDVADLAPAPEGMPAPRRGMVRLFDGKKEKLRPGDLLGALTAAAGFRKEQIGTIRVTDRGTWVAVDRGLEQAVLRALATTPVKGKIRRATAPLGF